MSETRNVHLHCGRHVHPIYREQMHAVPRGWRYATDHPALASDATTATKRVTVRGSALARIIEPAEDLALLAASEAGYIHFNRVRAPRASMIHSCERLLLRSPLPYVLDYEHAELFSIYQRAAFERPWALAVLERALLDPRLRFLLAWSKTAQDSLEEIVSPATARALRPKLRVVSPAVRVAATRPRARTDGPLRLLFVGTKFYEKGGVEALRAVERVRAAHDVRLDIVTYAPPEQGPAFEADGITLHRPGGTDLIQHLYERCDALLFPSHMDTFGYVVLEAMAHGLPVLTPDHLALAETVADGVTGIRFPPENMLYGSDTRSRFRHSIPLPAALGRALRDPSDPYVDGVATAIAQLAADPGLYTRLSAGALESVSSGVHSIAHRRAALGEIYDAASG